MISFQNFPQCHLVDHRVTRIWISQIVPISTMEASALQCVQAVTPVMPLPFATFKGNGNMEAIAQNRSIAGIQVWQVPRQMWISHRAPNISTGGTAHRPVRVDTRVMSPPSAIVMVHGHLEEFALRCRAVEIPPLVIQSARISRIARSTRMGLLALGRVSLDTLVMCMQCARQTAIGNMQAFVKRCRAAATLRSEAPWGWIGLLARVTCTEANAHRHVRLVARGLPRQSAVALAHGPLGALVELTAGHQPTQR
jgi:hypothetical protein